MRFILITLLSLIILNCSVKREVETSFFVAGHSYGNPKHRGTVKGLYKPFVDKFDFINEQENMKFGVLLGDVVWAPNVWPEAKLDIAKLTMPIHIARGNHDGPLKRFEKDFGKSYKKFVEKDNLYIILDPNIDHWNISNKQLDFFKNTLKEKPENIKNIFVFSHQLLWWNKGDFSKPKPNSLAKRDEETNFWTIVEPLLKSQEIPVYLYAGDVGAFSKEKRKRDHIIEYYYHKYDNITFIATGMGGGVRDNFVITDVFNDGTVEFRLIHLNGDNIHSLGKLEDY